MSVVNLKCLAISLVANSRFFEDAAFRSDVFSRIKASYPPGDTLEDIDIAAARWAWEHGHPAGRGADTLPGAKRLYVPLRTGRAALGAIGLDSDRRDGPLLTPEQQRLLDALADQAALAIERV